jgi:hypothetical protein
MPLRLLLLCYIVVGVVCRTLSPKASPKTAFNTTLPDPGPGPGPDPNGSDRVTICENGGTKNVVIDSTSQTQTLQWGIGLVSSWQSPATCRSSMSMDYDPSWQYAVTKVDWKTQVSLPTRSQAILSLAWAFDPRFSTTEQTTVSSHHVPTLFLCAITLPC